LQIIYLLNYLCLYFQIIKMPGKKSKSKYTSRREIIKAVVFGTGSLAATSVLGSTPLIQNGSFTTTKKELYGKTAFITGGARGIGLAVA
jgi:hypothetical protein